MNPIHSLVLVVVCAGSVATQSFPTAEPLVDTPELRNAVESAWQLVQRESSGGRVLVQGVGPAGSGFDREERALRALASTRASELQFLRRELAQRDKLQRGVDQGRARARNRLAARGPLRWPTLSNDPVLCTDWNQSGSIQDVHRDLLRRQLDEVEVDRWPLSQREREPAACLRARYLLSLQAAAAGRESLPARELRQRYLDFVLNGTRDSRGLVELPPPGSVAPLSFRPSDLPGLEPAMREAFKASLAGRLTSIQGRHRGAAAAAPVEPLRRLARDSLILRAAEQEAGRDSRVAAVLEQLREHERVRDLAVETGNDAERVRQEWEISSKSRLLEDLNAQRFQAPAVAAGRERYLLPDLNVFFLDDPSGLEARVPQFANVADWIFEGALKPAEIDAAIREQWTPVHADLRSIVRHLQAGERGPAADIVARRRAWLLGPDQD